MQRRRPHAALCALVFVVGSTAPASVAEARTTWHVDAGNCPGPGTGTVGNPFCSIQDAINAAGDGVGDVVEVQPGIYVETIDFLGKGLIVRGAGHPGEVVIYGNNAGTVVRFASAEGADSMLQSLTVTGGFATFGGGVLVSGASPTILDCVIAANQAADGGGIAILNGSSVLLSGVSFSSNAALDTGGGVYVDNSSGVGVGHCTFDANVANGGGAFHCNGNALISSTVFAGNTVNFDGGAINNQGGDIQMVNCLVRGNEGAGATGAALSNLFGGLMTITNCTIVENDGIDIGGVHTFKSLTTVVNSIVWGNTPSQVGGDTMTVDHSNVQGGWAGTGNIDVDPMFVDDEGRCGPGSVVTDAGLNAAPALQGVTSDLDGNPRFVDPTDPYAAAPTVDMGAYEIQLIDPAFNFLAPYGLENFPQQYIDALQAFLAAEEAYLAEDYAAAQSILAALWLQYPTGSFGWTQLPYAPFGINIGAPACYYALRMLTDMTEWRLANPDHEAPPRTARLTVLLVAQTSGLQPQNIDDLQNGTGLPVVNTLDPRLEADGHAVIHESLRLFLEYSLVAITRGQLGVDTEILSLPAVELPVHANLSPAGFYYAGLVNASQIWEHVPQEVIETTDWWWIVYPSHVPDDPVFDDIGFVTGGMGIGPDGTSPFFIIDDLWLVRKPPHLGSGDYSSVERRAYLPQWLQHEFYHHLYRTYPEFGLEAESHQWFDLQTWPWDFQGIFEPDYYHESLFKRLHCATPALHVALRYATAGAPWDQLTIDDVLGDYRREPWANPWHSGSIQYVGEQLEWHNDAGVSWTLHDDLANGTLITEGSPYDDDFHFILERDDTGDLIPTVAGFGFNGDLFQLEPLCAEAPGGVTGWWTGESDASDAIGGNHAALVGGADAGAPAVVGSGFELDGVNDRVVIPGTDLDLRTMAIALWINPDDVASGGQRLVTRFNGTASEPGAWLIDFAANGTLRFAVQSTAGLIHVASPVPVVVPGEWQFVAATFDGSTATLHHNDVEMTSTAAPFGLIPPLTQPIVIGEDEPVNTDEHYAGRIDELLLFDRALDCAEVLTLYHAGSWGMCLPCPPDTNGDGSIDVSDLVAVILDWGTDGSANNGDIDGSGLVDIDDLVAVILGWGPCA